MHSLVIAIDVYYCSEAICYQFTTGTSSMRNEKGTTIDRFMAILIRSFYPYVCVCEHENTTQRTLA